ncbi:hypothetical protein [Pusillimonas sp.]|uniref:hypothetical protein n=1 Tax=Pusillimonas sp. TaxID=3040095 RepID=UPI0037C7E0F8
MTKLQSALCTLALGFSLTAFNAAAQSTADTQADAGAGTTQQSNSQARDNAAMTDEQRDQRHEVEMKRCESMQGDEKDICEKQADANRDKAEAESERSEKTADATHDANKEKKDAQYKVEKEKCKAMSGDAQDRCMDEIKTRFDK